MLSQVSRADSSWSVPRTQFNNTLARRIEHLMRLLRALGSGDTGQHHDRRRNEECDDAAYPALLCPLALLGRLGAQRAQSLLHRKHSADAALPLHSLSSQGAF
ncbi:hypothetical protein VTN00DRAFT_1216 [Thermoascus crustaceus]|uniref:uncharacterized protein n=1 Tax=Thermoascus crustaceus TaxID=5088 RepID=UPI0037432AEE